MSTSNKTFIYKKLPSGLPIPGEHLTVEDRPIDLSAVPSGGLIVKNLYASYDPYLRRRMRDPCIKSYAPAFAIDGPVINSCVAKIIKSDVDEYKEGELVVTFVPIAEYAIVQPEIIDSFGMCYRIHNPYNLYLGCFLGVLGIPGLTAWSSLYKIGKPKRGETIFVSSAAGAVGQVVGQLAKLEGLKVIGSVGLDEKLEFIVQELGFDAGTNYKRESTSEALKRLCPEGIDIYYENVGGEMLDAALAAMKQNGRVVVCGMVKALNTVRFLALTNIEPTDLPIQLRKPVSAIWRQELAYPHV